MAPLFLWTYILLWSVCLASSCGLPKIPHKENNTDVISTDVVGGINKNVVGGISKNVVGGVVAAPYSWPWQAQIRKKEKQNSFFSHLCGGTLIHKQWVLTAAHCIEDGTSTSDLEVHLGKFYKDILSENITQVYQAECIIRHEDWNIDLFGDDIALIKLTTEANITDYVSIACLPTAGSDLDTDMFCYTTGWGYTYGTGGESMLKQGFVPVRDRGQCRESHEANYPVTEDMICAGSNEADSCQGDSGGPLVCQLGNRTNSDPFILNGLVSWGAPSVCGDHNFPGVYTRISNYISWIEEVMAENQEQCSPRMVSTSSATSMTTTTTVSTTATTPQCIHRDSVVTVFPGVRKRVSDMSPGDRVLTMNTDTMTLTFSPFLADVHSDTSSSAIFITLKMSSGHVMRATSNHLVYACVNCSAIYQAKMTPMKLIRPGNVLFLASTNWWKMDTVIKTWTEVHTGVSSPLTSTGTLIIDSILTSCYVQMLLPPQIIHHFTLPLTLFVKYYSSTSTTYTKFIDFINYFKILLTPLQIYLQI